MQIFVEGTKRLKGWIRTSMSNVRLMDRDQVKLKPLFMPDVVTQGAHRQDEGNNT